MKDILKLIRPHQWSKNMFVFLPLFFGGVLLRPDALVAAVVVFFAYSLVASSVYCFNDIVDVEADRRHPVKCKRPIASGAVSLRTGYLLMVLLLVLSMALLLLLPAKMRWSVMAVLGGYYLLNLAYCSWLKQYAILDVCIVAFGFVLRIAAGAYAAQVVPSQWIVLMTFLLTLFLSFAKRRDDVLRMNETGEAPRKNTNRYNLTFINQAVTITASVTLVCYIMYTVSPEVVERFHTHYLYVTSVFVLVGLLRYIQIAVVDEQSGDPTKVVLRDRFLQLVVLAWIVSFLLIIYIV
ncbi:MAG: decaprenyl-phosphate phosphoribosyltransferase [Prevotella sp.]|nr:decaprenyl-phosphate phosphoribosyltransferase [Prevotella sp.]